MLHIFVDADACPVKTEVYRVATRYRLGVTLVANAWMRTPDCPWLNLKIVGEEPDAADDWIVINAESGDIVVTSDIPLAGRCLQKQARVLTPKGKQFTDSNIGSALATREILAGLRSAGEITGGPLPLSNHDRSRFLQELDRLVCVTRREMQKPKTAGPESPPE